MASGTDRAPILHHNGLTGRPDCCVPSCQLIVASCRESERTKGLFEEGDPLIGGAVQPPLMGPAPHELWHLCTVLHTSPPRGVSGEGGGVGGALTVATAHLGSGEFRAVGNEGKQCGAACRPFHAASLRLQLPHWTSVGQLEGPSGL